MTNSKESLNRRTCTVVIPDGYASAEELAKDCGFELVSSEISDVESDLKLTLPQILCAWRDSQRSDVPFAHLSKAEKKAYESQADDIINYIRPYLATRKPVMSDIPMKMSVRRLMEAIEAVTQIRLMIWRQNAQGEGFGCIKEYGEDIILALHELISRREAAGVKYE